MTHKVLSTVFLIKSQRIIASHMPHNLELNLTILDQFTPNVLGFFWITPSVLDRDLKGFNDFNYLFDGLLSQYIYRKEKEFESKETSPANKYAHIFFTQNFDEKLFLAHLACQGLSKTQIAGDIDEQISLINNSSDRKKTILVLDQTDQNWTVDLTKRYPQYEFKNLKIK